MTGPVLQFKKDSWIAISGADLSPKLNGKEIENHSVYKVNSGDELTFGKHIDGLRGYVAIKGGFETPLVLNSRSFYKPITEKDHLSAGMEIAYQEVSEFKPKITHIITGELEGKVTLEVSQGPEFEILSKDQKELLFRTSFTIAMENNRMAYQLQEPVGEHQHAMLTSATLPGTVQLTPGGKLIILMRDGQTTGGYPRILQLTDNSINLLAQKTFGDTVELRMKS
jgi:allophanate hydrolase subunit 2